MPERVREETAYERSDAGALLVFGLAALAALVAMLSIGILSLVYAPALSPPAVTPKALPPKPRLLLNEPAALGRFEARQKQRLNSWGWADKERGIVRMPIEEAMKRAAQQGFPDWPGNPK